MKQRGRRSYFRPVVLLLTLLLLAGLTLAVNDLGCPGDPMPVQWRSGDILFLSGTSFRSKCVRLLEGYAVDYSHVGLIVVKDGVPFVINADPAAGVVVIQRWDIVTASDQVAGGAVYRLRGVDPSAVSAACLAAQRDAQEHIPFDESFDLNTPGRLFCTELVWRAYRSAGVNLCPNAETDHPHLLPTDLLENPKLQRVLRF